MNADLIVLGLGNPGPKYTFTRHNIGFLAVDLLAQNCREKFKLDSKFSSEWCEGTLGMGSKALLLKPQTYMNISGEALRALYQKHSHLRSKALIVIQDEVDLPFGTIKVKFGGGDAGHNGLKSLREHLGHGDYFRIRLGVGKPHGDSKKSMATHVLENFSKDEMNTVVSMCARSVDLVELLAQSKLQAAQELAAKALP